ncbi:MAG: universal stress protein [Cellvibrionaceae bacterium]
MKRILVIADPYEEEQIAFEKAIDIAKHTVADLHVIIFCYESFSFEESEKNTGLEKMVIDRVKQWWKNYVRSQNFDVSVQYNVVWEKHISAWILHHCKENTYDLIVKTGKRSESFFHTPTDWQLFRKSNTSVYSVNESEAKRNKVILACLDLMSNHDSKNELNKKILEEAFKLAVQTNSVLHCCFSIQASKLLEDSDVIDIEKHIDATKVLARVKALKLFDLYELEEKNFHIKYGIPQNFISELSKLLRAECVVIGSMGRVGVSGKIIGNTAEKVIPMVNSDLLVVSSA